MDYSRLLKLCGDADRKIARQTLHYLEQNFSTIKVELEKKLEQVAEELKIRPLRKFRKSAQLKASCELIEMSGQLPNWDFLGCTEPTKTGIVCGNGFLLTPEFLKALGLFERDEKEYTWGEKVFDLDFSLFWWRNTVCILWSGIILKGLISYFQNKKMLIGEVAASSPDQGRFMKDIDMSGPLGEYLAFPYITDEEADKFYRLYDRALFGSRYIGDEAAGKFKNFLAKLNLGILQDAGIDFDQAHVLLVAASQSRPEIDIELLWNSSAGNYDFVCQVKNMDCHGFEDKTKVSPIPQQVLFNFYNNADPKTQENLMRLLIRGGWQKARDLLFMGIERSLD